jgi:hypothetical protein
MEHPSRQHSSTADVLARRVRDRFLRECRKFLAAFSGIIGEPICRKAKTQIRCDNRRLSFSGFIKISTIPPSVFFTQYSLQDKYMDIASFDRSVQIDDQYLFRGNYNSHNNLLGKWGDE